jgi:hypothetical protein
MTKVIKYYTEAMNIIAQNNNILSPNVVIMPYEPIIDKAIKVLKKMDPNYFSGVSKIVIGSSSYFGHVESGPDKDPTIININLEKIKQYSNQSKGEIGKIFAAAVTIAHERAHVKSFNQQLGFVGGENPALAEEQKVANWISDNINNLKSIVGV